MDNRPITPLEKLKPYNRKDKPYTNPPYELLRPLLFDLFHTIDREVLKQYVNRAYSEYAKERQEKKELLKKIKTYSAEDKY